MVYQVGGTNVIDNNRNINVGIITGTTFGSSSQNAFGARTVSTSDPSGGSNGDIWYKVSS
tara:strand:+ start:1434 stop:1613 length:180 start_codon:yes stop_codon:yes gene_type:complete